MRPFLIAVMALFILSCKEKSPQKETQTITLNTGTYRGVLKVQDNEELPFIFQVLNASSVKVYNAKEVIDVTEISQRNDSIVIQMPVFEGYIIAAYDGENLKGSFVKESLNRVVPFYAEYNNAIRFKTFVQPEQDVTGIWETVFSQGIEGDEYIAKGVFTQKGRKVKGTFRTTTGDYRFLEGIMDGDTMKLSTFDGAHAFLFTAAVTDSSMEGTFYSGNHWKEPFVAKRNPNYELPNANDLTFLKDGYERIDFTFPNADGKMISLTDERFKDKVVVVQIMGSWCPNCLDESKYFAEFYKNNRDKAIEFVSLAFEVAKTKDKAFERINRLKTKIGIDYPILLAQYGTSDKLKAQEKLPMLSHVLSYPTSIMIDKNGKVRNIHTGFNGPATGEKYTEFKQEFEGLVEELLAE